MTQIQSDVTIKETRLYSEAVSITGYGKFNIYLLLATGGCLMCVIIETMCMSFVIPAAQCDLNLSLTQKGVLVSISFLGIISTSHFWGFMADVRGRKNVLIFCLISSSLASLACSIVPWSWLFILLRGLNGALIGGSSSVIYAFGGEFHDDSHRPMVISLISSFVSVGQMYIPGMAWVVLPQDWNVYIESLGITFRPWRLLVIVYALPSLIVAAMLSILPESPKFLLAQGKHDHTIKILTRMFVINKGKKPEEFPVTTIILDEEVVETKTKRPNMFKFLWRQTASLFKGKFLLKTVLICYLQFGVFLSASSLSLWFPDILNNLTRYAQQVGGAEVTLCGAMLRNESNGTIQEDICDDSVDTGVYLVVLLIAAAMAGMYIIISLVITRIGKKKIFISVTTFTGACGLVAQYISGYETILILCGVYLMISAMIGVVNSLAVDLYPTHIRAMALAISLMFGRAGALIGSNVTGVIFYSYCGYIFIFFAINHLILVAAAIFLPTKRIQNFISDQKETLEECEN